MPMNPRLLRPTAAGGFNPRRISGLFLWLDPSDESTLGNTSTGTGGATSNGPVKYIADKSGGGRHATQSGADSAAPTLLQGALNGRSVLGYDGGDSLNGVFGDLVLTAQTTFAVVRRNASAPAFARVFSQQISGQANDFSPAGHYIPIILNAGATALGSFSTSSSRAPISLATNTWQVFSSRHTGSAIENRFGLGSYTTATGQTLNSTFQDYRVGRGTGADTTYWQDRIGELISYSRALSNAEADRVVSYLLGKYAIT